MSANAKSIGSRLAFFEGVNLLAGAARSEEAGLFALADECRDRVAPFWAAMSDDERARCRAIASLLSPDDGAPTR